MLNGHRGYRRTWTNAVTLCRACNNLVLPALKDEYSGYVYCMDCWRWWWKRMCYWTLRKVFRVSPIAIVWNLLGEIILEYIELYDCISLVVATMQWAKQAR